MKGFRNSTKTVSGHTFPADRGFTGSSGQVCEVSPYTRRAPVRTFAEGGRVDSSMTSREKPVTQSDVESGGRSPLRPGFAKGGALMAAKRGTKAVAKKPTAFMAIKAQKGPKAK